MKKRHLLLLVTLLLVCGFRGYSTELSGTYTIDSSLSVGTAISFKNFTSAIAYLSGTGSRNDGGPANTAPFGVSGPVIFNVKKGRYTEQVSIPVIAGASDVNRITFQSQATNADSVVLQFNSTTTANDYTVNLGTSSFITFKYITLSALNITFPNVITLSGAASYNTILHCKINSPITTVANTSYGLIYSSSISGWGNIFKHNIFTGGTCGIYLTCFATANMDSMIIDSNVFTDIYYYAIYTYKTKNLKVRGNTITTNSTHNSLTILYLYQSDSALEVTNNKITANIGGGTGIFVNTSVTSAAKRSIVANNTVTMTGTAGNVLVGIRDQSNATFRDFIHNSVNITSENIGSAAVWGMNYTSGLCQNNIFACNGPGFAAFGHYGSGGNSNYNIFYSTGIYLINKVFGSNYTNLADFQTAALSDSNSISGKPEYVSSTDLHLKSGCAKGIYLSSASNDLDGNIRLNPPLIGAYEYTAIANNLAVKAISIPSATYSTGVQDLAIRVRNEGSTYISSFNITYILNGAAPVSQLWTGSIGQCDTVSIVFPGVALTGVNNLTFYTTLPNGVADSDRSNDTLNITSFASLSGTYTIGGSSPDFATFNAAASQLINVGVSGPVVFEVRNGTYTEQFGFANAIKGASATNTVTFRSQSGIADSVLLVSNNYVFANNYIINIGPASYITIKDMSFNTSFNSSKEYYTAIRLTGDNTNTRGLPSPSFNTITGCKFIFTGVTADGGNGNSNGLITINNLATNNTISKNTFISGAMAIQANYALSGAGSGSIPGPQPSNLIIDSNTFINQYHSAIWIAFISNLKIRGNTISINSTSTNSPYGINTSYLNFNPTDSALEITGNKININCPTGGSVGIYLNSLNSSASSPGLIANNSIVLNSTNAFGIYEYNGSYHSYYHNSVNITGPGSCGYFIPSAGGNCIVKNNIFKMNGSGTATSLTAGRVVSDYNQLYTTGVFLSASYTSLSSYQAGTGQDSNSVSTVPDFVSATDLHLTSGSVKGVFIPAVTKDINGIIRANPPVVGAYEYMNINNNISVRGILQPGYPFNSGSQDLKIIVQNIGANAVTSYNLSYVLNGASPVVQARSVSLATYAYDTVVFPAVNFVNSNNFSIYTSLPNGVPDADMSTDTLKTTKYPALSGTYTIGTPGDYSSFTAAAADLTLRGIKGAVTFNIAAGSSFTEAPVTFSNIAGNNNYPITFQKNGSGPNPVIYGKAGTGSIDAVIKIQGLNYITFNGIDVQDSASNANATTQMEYGYAIINTAILGSSGNTIKNCSIALKRTNTATIGLVQYSSATGGGVAATAAFNNTNNNNRYENIKITNAYSGIILGGTITAFDTNNVITSSGGDTTIIGSISADDIGGSTALVFGIQVINQKNVEVSRCIVRNLKTTGVTLYGIFILNSQGAITLDFGNAIVKNNLVYNLIRANTTVTLGAYGILVNLNNNARADVINNVVHSMYTSNPTAATANSVIRGIAHCVAGNGNANYYHNTVKIGQDTALNASSAAFWKGGNSVLTTVKNNVFINTTAAQSLAAKHYAFYMNTATLISSSNNLLWSANTNGSIGYYNLTDRPTLSNFRIATNMESGSLSYLPNLTVTNNLQPDPADTASWALNGRGTHLTLTSGLINTDLLSNPRPASRTVGVPDIGAYEVTPTSQPPLAKAIPEMITSNPPVDTVQVFLFGEDTVCRIKWSAGSNIGTTPQIRRYSGVQPPQSPGANNKMYAYNTVYLPGLPGAPSYSIDFYYQNEWLGNNINETDLTLTRFALSNSWQVDGGITSVDTIANIIRTSSLFGDTSFSITGTNFNDPLPVKLINLTAKKSEKDIILNWLTASELNSSRFDIERSFDGKQFEKAGNVKAAGNSSKPLGYNYADMNPCQGKSVKSIYYRLLMLDNDGKSEYSNTVSVTWDERLKDNVTVFPNPFNDQAYLSVLSDEATVVKAEIRDITGRTIGTQEFNINKGVNTLMLNTTNLNSGIYFVNVEYNGVQTVKKIIRQ